VSVPVYVVLLHYPMRNRVGEVVTTAVTNLDIHDISRSCRTFGVREYVLVTPIVSQHQLVRRILGHWGEEPSKQWHPDRAEALSRVRIEASFEDLIHRLSQAHGQKPEVVLTDASQLERSISYTEYRRELEDRSKSPDPRPVVIVFGTGWGVDQSFHPAVDRILAPIYGPEGPQEEGGYNHLSVRAAAAIILDRLFGH
jgi:hypothetical protein